MRTIELLHKYSPALLCLSVLWLLFGFRLIGLLAFAVLFFVYLSSQTVGRAKRLGWAWAVFVLCMVSPLDISLRNVAGGPRIVPYVMGLPSPLGRAEEARGKVVFGGCVVSGLEPRWVIVW
jgi:hypothetical protein